MLLKLLPGWYCRNFISALLILIVFTALNVFILNLETIYASIVRTLKASDYCILKLESETWGKEQRKEIIGFAQQMPEVLSVAEVKTLRWANQLPLIKGVSIEYLENNHGSYNLNRTELQSFQNFEETGFVSRKLAEHFNLQLHRQYNWFGLIFRVKGFFESENPQDNSTILLHRELIDQLSEASITKHFSEVFIELQLVSSIKCKTADKKDFLEGFKRRMDSVNTDVSANIPIEIAKFSKSLTRYLINMPQDLRISTQPELYEAAYWKELAKLNDWRNAITLLLILILIFLFFMGINNFGRLEQDLKFLKDFGLTSGDFFWLTLFFNFFQLLISMIAALLFFSIFNENNWLAVKSFTITQNLNSQVFSNWLSKTGVFLLIWCFESYFIIYIILNPEKLKKQRQFMIKVFNIVIKPIKYIGQFVHKLKTKKTS